MDPFKGRANPTGNRARGRRTSSLDPTRSAFEVGGGNAHDELGRDLLKPVQLEAPQREETCCSGCHCAGV